jgi:Glycosyl hydrolases family 2, TIM barrel domain
MRFTLSLVALAFAFPSAMAAEPSRPIPVKIEKIFDNHRLLRDGKPYFIKGAGGRSYLDVLKATGGNSIRTWGEEEIGPLLDRCQELGLTVTVGIWLGQPRQGFRYDNETAVRGEIEKSRRFFRRYKDHPAVLMWGLGNEMEGDGNDPKVWKTVNEIAKIAHKEDPNHPTMTVVAELGGKKLEMYRTLCPDVDVLGVNSYAGLRSLADRLEKAKFDRPYVVTEYGPPGPWEVGKTPWNAPFEPSSTAKAHTIQLGYAVSIANNQRLCLGSYAFLWGNKQEATSTWFGLFLPTGERLETVDFLAEAWTGKPPSNRSPRIEKIAWEGQGKEIEPGSTQQAKVVADDPDGDPLTVRWEVRSESMDRREGGDREAEPPPHPESFVEARGMGFAFKAPTLTGPCRLFVFVYDGRGNAATTNVPFLVKGKTKVESGE